MPHHNEFAYRFIFSCKQGCEGEEDVSYIKDTLTIECSQGHQGIVDCKEACGEFFDILDLLQQKLKETFCVAERSVQENPIQDLERKMYRSIQDWLNDSQ